MPALHRIGRHGTGGSRICCFKAALRRQRLRYRAILSNVAVRSYDGALRSYMALVGGGEISFPTLMVPGTLELNMTQRT